MQRRPAINRVPKQERAVQTRLKIIETAIQLFSQKGYHQTSSNEISDVAGVSIGSFYAYFQDKKQLFMAALDYYDDKVNSVINVEAIPEHSSPEATLREFLWDLLEAHRVFPDFHQEIEVMAVSDPDVRKTIHEQKEAELEHTLRLLSSWSPVLRVGDLRLSASILHNLVHANIHDAAFGGSAHKAEAVIEELVVVIRRYLFGGTMEESTPDKSRK